MITGIEYTRGTHPTIVVRGSVCAEHIENDVCNAFMRVYQELRSSGTKLDMDSTEGQDIEGDDSISKDSLLGAYSDSLFCFYRTTPNALNRWIRGIRSEVTLKRGVVDSAIAKIYLDGVVDTLRKSNPDAIFKESYQ